MNAFKSIHLFANPNFFGKMKKLLFNNLNLFFILAFLFVACEKDELEVPSNVISNIRSLDIDNADNPSDLVVFFELQPGDLSVSEVRLVLIKQTENSLFNIQEGRELSNERYASVAANGNNLEVRLSVSQKDFKGNNIERGINYTIRFLIVTDDNILLDARGEQVSLTDEHYLEGKVSGTWNDQQLSNWGISAELSYNKNTRTLSGPFFFRADFLPFGLNATDGTIKIVLGQNQDITTFTLNTLIDEGTGDSCEGTWTGSGKIEDYTTLNIEFTGIDCDGEWSGNLVLE